MDLNRFKELFEKLIKYLNHKLDRRFMVFLFFVALSTIFWFLVRLEDDYETEINLPLKFVNLPENNVLVGDLPEDINLKIRAHGYKLMEFKVSNALLPFVVDLKEVSLRIQSEDERSRFYLLSSSLMQDIEKHISSQISIIDVSPDSLYFDFAPRVWKKIPVQFNGQLNLMKQHMIREIILDPDSITVSGPGTIIDTLKFVSTENIYREELAQNIDEDVKLKKNSSMEYDVDEVHLKVIIEKFTESSIEIPIKNINVPDSLVLRTFPNVVNVVYFVGLSDFDKVLPQLFDAYVDYEDTKSNKDKLEVKLTRYPEYISSIRIVPGEVDYIIEIE